VGTYETRLFNESYAMTRREPTLRLRSSPRRTRRRKVRSLSCVSRLAVRMLTAKCLVGAGRVSFVMIFCRVEVDIDLGMLHGHVEKTNSDEGQEDNFEIL